MFSCEVLQSCNDLEMLVYDSVMEHKRGRYLMKKIIQCTLFVCICLSVFTGCKYDTRKSSENYIEVPEEASVLEGKNFKTVSKSFEEAGFTNINTVKIEDLITGWLTKDGEVEEISINGDTKFSSGKRYKSDAEIVISYHTFPKRSNSKDGIVEDDVTEEVTNMPYSTKKPKKNKKGNPIISEDGKTFYFSGSHKYNGLKFKFDSLTLRQLWSGKHTSNYGYYAVFNYSVENVSNKTRKFNLYTNTNECRMRKRKLAMITLSDCIYIDGKYSSGETLAPGEKLDNLKVAYQFDDTAYRDDKRKDLNLNIIYDKEKMSFDVKIYKGSSLGNPDTFCITFDLNK